MTNWSSGAYERRFSVRKSNRIAIINIKDLIKNSSPRDPSSENSHQWLDAGGWTDRIAYMMDHDVIYPVILHISQTRDGRHLLYDVSVIKNEGSTVDIDATALTAQSTRASATQETGLQSAVKSIEPSGGMVTQPEAKVNPKSLTPGEEGVVVNESGDPEIAAEQVEQADRDLEADVQYSDRKDVKTFKNGKNAKGEFIANILIDLTDSNSKWWTGRHNRAILGMSKTDDTEFRQFHQEIEKRTKDMKEYGDANNPIVEDSFIVQDGNGKEYVYVVKLDGYLHGVVLEKIDFARHVQAMK